MRNGVQHFHFDFCAKDQADLHTAEGDSSVYRDQRRFQILRTEEDSQDLFHLLLHRFFVPTLSFCFLGGIDSISGEDDVDYFHCGSFQLAIRGSLV